MALAIVLLVDGLLIDGGISFYAAPQGQGGTTVTVTVTGSGGQVITKPPLEGQTVRLGYIARAVT